MKEKKIIWKILLIIGLIPFLAVIIYGIFSSINGFSGICFFNCSKNYGLMAFRDSVIMYSYVLWPTYIIGIILIIISIIKINWYKRG